MDNVKSLEDKLVKALVDAEVAKEIAKNAMEIAQQALIKVEAMSKSTHTVTTVDPFKGISGDAGEVDFNKIEEMSDIPLDDDPMGEFE